MRPENKDKQSKEFFSKLNYFGLGTLGDFKNSYMYKEMDLMFSTQEKTWKSKVSFNRCRVFSHTCANYFGASPNYFNKQSEFDTYELNKGFVFGFHFGCKV